MNTLSATAVAEPQLPSSGVRGVVSYLLFIHFFFLLVGIKSNTSSSGLDQDLRNKVPGLKPYLQLTAMDLSYMFHLTYYDGENLLHDTDYWFEADVPQAGSTVPAADGSTRLVRFTPLGVSLPVRAHRYDRLAFRAGFYVEGGDDNLMSLLPQAVARRIMLEQNCRELTIRVRRRLLQNLMLPNHDPRAQLERSRTSDDPAYFQTVYEAHAYTTETGEVSLLRVKAASDTAAPQGTTPQRQTSQPPTPVPQTTVPPASLNLTDPRGPSLVPPLPFPSATGTGGSRP